MKIDNTNPSHPKNIVTADGKTIGQFYNSIDGKYHLAEYVPYKTPPKNYVCGGIGNFSPSRSDGNQCLDCWSKFK